MALLEVNRVTVTGVTAVACDDVGDTLKGRDAAVTVGWKAYRREG